MFEKQDDDSPDPSQPIQKNIKGDHISFGNVYDRAVLAIGRSARAEVRIFNIDIRLLPLVVLLSVISLVLAFLLWYEPIPTEMIGEFNIAVTEFAVVDADNQRVKSEDGRNLANFLYQEIDSNLKALDLQSGQPQVWPPEYTDVLPGDTADERAASAQKLADRINADIIVTGVISSTGDRARFEPQFFVTFKGFQEAPEITGVHQLGKPVIVPLPFDPNALVDIENPALSARVNALTNITIGLAYYAIDDFDAALEYFYTALDSNGWLRSAGKEVAYLLIANTNVRLASIHKSTEFLEAALENYQEAAEIRPGYARAQAGEALVLYLEALGNPNDPSFETVNLDLLDQAEAKFLMILDQDDLPQSANLEIKIQFYLGLINFVRAQTLDEEIWMIHAKDAFEKVVQAYENGNTTAALQAGYAHGQLALIARLNGDSQTAIKHYKQAIELVTPFEQGAFYLELGAVHEHLEQEEEALEAYNEALQIAEFFGNDTLAHLAEEALVRLSAD
ncbi:MAG: tetratricopeptide repeat protein [Anaerolineales bacterium]|nr:tetratricopeptide repeat protein [Anaerolineales bacterium]